MDSTNKRVLNYSIRGICLQIRYFPEGLRWHIINLLEHQYNFIRPATSLRRTDIRLNVSAVYDISFQILKKAKLILKFSAHNIMVYKKGDYIFLTDNLNLFILQTEQKKGILIIKRHDKLILLSVLSRLFPFALFELLSTHGLFYLHASGVVKNGHRVLFVSEGGGGKSTSALSLFLEGWRFLSDDQIFLRYNNKQRVTALSFTTVARLKRQNPILKKDKFLFLQKFYNKSENINNFFRLDVAAIAPNRLVKSFIPNLIFFPRVRRSKFSMLKSIDESQALLFLLKQSKSIFFGWGIAKNNAKMLFNLTEQAKSFILEIGTDIQDGRLSLSDLISSQDIGIEN